MVNIYFNKINSVEINIESVEDVKNLVAETLNLNPVEFYLEQNGKRMTNFFEREYPIYVRLCVFGGKGGFGSMLRAIGAQIEKTTNREACRDLSGRRLRDINEEKRLKAWLEKQGDREREAEERKKRKIEKLLSVPKHEFKDEQYEDARSNLTEKVCNAVEEGLKKSEASKTNLKRTIESPATHNSVSKKKKRGLWLDDELSSSDDTDESDDTNNIQNKKTFFTEKQSQETSSKEVISSDSDCNENTKNL